MKTKSPLVPANKMQQRAKSAKLGRATFKKGFLEKHPDLLVNDPGKKYDFSQKGADFVALRKKSPDPKNEEDAFSSGEKIKKKKSTKLFS